MPFLAIPQQVWWPKFWAQVDILVKALDKEMDDFVGPDRAPQVERHLARNKKNIEDQTEAMIARAQQRLAQRTAGTMTSRMIAEWDSVGDLTAGMAHQVPQQCPACEFDGVLQGDEERQGT